VVDWESKAVSIAFTPGCNFACPYCFNSDVVERGHTFKRISEEEVFSQMHASRALLDGICITGGEPTLQHDLPDFCAKVQAQGFQVKLDTNGTNPLMLQKLLSSQLVQYIAMDIKAPLSASCYQTAAGISNPTLLANIRKSISLLMSSGIDYEFRTTLVPSMHSQQDVALIAKGIKGAKRYILQKLQPMNARDEHVRTQKRQEDSEMQTLVSTAAPFVQEARFRGI
jgi:pyruvate formate lyase activating enzyme